MSKHSRGPASEKKKNREGFVEIEQLDPSKKTVCGMTLNSDNEILAFQRHLGPNKNFQFVELVTESEDWFAQAIQKKVKCDVLVVSGHFGGRFFGTNGSLALEDLEKASCSEGAYNLLQNPKEVFLFGCNTLAGKVKDHRSPEEYIRILLNDGFTSAQAHQIAAFRYSPIGSTFHDRMSRVFSGVPRIYGFSSVGPSGLNVEGLLDQYFKSVPDYEKYLSNIDSKTNTKFLTALKSTVVVQTKGATQAALKDSPRCIFQNPKVKDATKMILVGRLLKDSENRLNYLREVSSYLLTQPRDGSSARNEVGLMRSISEDQILRTDMHTILDVGLKTYPTLRLEMLAIGRHFGWFSDADRTRIAQEVVGDFFKDGVTIEEKDTLCSMGEIAGEYVSYEMVKNHLRSEFGIVSLGCVRAKDPKIHKALVEVMKTDPHVELRGLVTDALRWIKPQDPRIHWELVEVIKTDADGEVRGGAIHALREINPKDSNIHWALVEVMRTDVNQYIRKFAADALGEIRPQDPKIHWALVEVIKDDTEWLTRRSAGEALQAIKPQDPKIHWALVEVMRTGNDMLIRKLAVDTLQAIKPQDPKIHWELVQTLKTNPDAELRGSAAYALGEIKPRDPKIHWALVEVMKTGNDRLVRKLAVDTLQAIKPQDPRIHWALVEVIRSGFDTEISVSAAYALGEIGPNDPKIHWALVEVMKTDDDRWVRKSAVSALGGVKPQDPKIHWELVQTLKTNPDAELRGSAAYALGEIKPQDPKIHWALVEVMKTDAEESVRSDAAYALGRTGSQDPTVHLALVEVMKTDADVWVRRTAAQSLEEIGSKDPKILKELELFRARAN